MSNVLVSCSVSRSCHPRYFYKTFVITNEVVTIITQQVSSLSLPSSVSSSSSSSPSLPPSYPVSYDYFVFSGRPSVRLFGRVYHEGDFTSRGMILRIFPDRILLMNGSVLENVSTTESSRKIKKELLKND